MSLGKILNSLEDSWKRDEVLIKINNGLDIDEIVNEFLIKNENQITKLNELLKPEDIDFLNQMEQLSTCEAKLINRINNLNYLNINKNNLVISKKNISPNKEISINRISKFMNYWSNKFLVISLLFISAIALSKQAWK